MPRMAPLQRLQLLACLCTENPCTRNPLKSSEFLQRQPPSSWVPGAGLLRNYAVQHLRNGGTIVSQGRLVSFTLL